MIFVDPSLLSQYVQIKVSGWFDIVLVLWSDAAIGPGQKLVIKTHQSFLSTEIFSKRRKIYPFYEEKPETRRKCICLDLVVSFQSKLPYIDGALLFVRNAVQAAFGMQPLV